MLYTIKNNKNMIATVDVATISTRYITLKTYIDIENYSYFLLKREAKVRVQIIKIFDGLNNLKQVIWEDNVKNDVIDSKKTLREIDNFIQTISDEFGLKVVRES